MCDKKVTMPLSEGQSLIEKDKLLSIGEMSKLTGAGIKALRHYEKINILKPAFVDKLSGYRYYTFSQTYVVALIKFAVELDIPLKELTKYVDPQGNIDFISFAKRGSEVVTAKMKTLERALKFFDFFEEKVALESEYPLNQLYTRRISRKIFHTLPYKKSFDNVDKYEVAKLFLALPYDTEDDVGWVEYGFMSEYSNKGVKRSVFVEVTQDALFANTNFQRKIIPAGIYHCQQTDSDQMEQAPQIFSEYLSGKSKFIAIETEIFFGNFNIHKPVNELRVIVL